MIVTTQSCYLVFMFPLLTPALKHQSLLDSYAFVY